MGAPTHHRHPDAVGFLIQQSSNPLSKKIAAPISAVIFLP